MQINSGGVSIFLIYNVDVHVCLVKVQKYIDIDYFSFHPGKVPYLSIGR